MTGWGFLLSSMSTWSQDRLMLWLMDTAVDAGKAGVRILAVIVAGVVAVRFLRLGLTRLQTWLIRKGEPREPFPGATRKRVATLTGLLRTIALALIWGIVAIIALEQLGLDVRPILAGAGIVGLAVGFGAQNLVRDLISGFFILLEEQVEVGDVAVVNGTGGLVEAISFRTITLRDEAGVVHVFPNGTITTLSNMTKEWSAYVINVGVAYREDTDRVVEVMRQVDEELRRDPAFAQKFLEPIEVFGVDDFGDSAVTIKARLKTRPIEQWAVGREYRRRLKKAFDARGIEFPYPARSVVLANADDLRPTLQAGQGQPQGQRKMGA